jgi:hypothetical protein
VLPFLGNLRAWWQPVYTQIFSPVKQISYTLHSTLLTRYINSHSIAQTSCTDPFKYDGVT